MISDVYFPRINGVSTSIETFRDSLHAQGVDTTLLAPAYSPAEEAGASTPGLVRLPAWRVPFDPEDRLMHRTALAQWLAARQPGEFDLVHVQTPFAAHYAGLRLARRLGIPALATYHTYFEEYLHHYVPLLPRAVSRALARRFSRGQCNALDALVVPSQAMAQALRDYGVTCPQHVIPTGVREADFTPGDGAGFRLRHQIEPTRPLLLFVGRVAHEKNIGFLLDVVEHLRRQRPDVLLLITGEGPAQDALRDDCERRALSHNVRFMGYLDRQQALADCYRAADLFVFASRTETQGLVLLEAMAQARPVLALSAMGTRDILEGNPGAVIAEDAPAAFAQRAAALLAQPAELARLGEQACAHARNWSAAQSARRLGDVYAGLCRGAAPGLPTPLAQAEGAPTWQETPVA
ncbi:MAG: glycosyltransferase [Candidatus Dactylopiibacterium sp.]|nr:glycosyltransferase [Candidatus Dactylopiibacterium sp.]